VINSKYLPGVFAVLFVLGAIIFAVNRWASTTEHVVSNPIKPKTTTSSVPEEFIDIEANSIDLDDPDTQRFAKLTTDALWQNLLSGFQNGNKIQISLENALIARLRKEPGTAIYEDLLLRFRQGTLDTVAQQVLLSLLGEVGNYKAAETLMSLVGGDLLKDPDVKLSAFHAISKFSPESWHEHANTELAPVFEAAWQIQDTEFLSAIANVMASIGTPSTLAIFTKTLTENTDEERVEIVRQAMTNLVNPALIPRLGEMLQKSEVEDVRVASAYALANMGQINAVTVLFEWSTQTDASDVDVVKVSFETAMNTTPEFVDYLDTHLSEQVFTSPEIKQAITEVLGDVKSGVE
jgi:hypothetical protein